MNALKIRVFMVITALILLLSESAVFAAWPVMSTDGRIAGDEADYQITIPEEIRPWISVSKAPFIEDDALIEGITFYCKSYSKKYLPIVIMRLYVYEKAHWNGLADHGLSVIMISRDYIFAAELSYENGFLEAQDQAYFSYCQSYLGNADAVKKMIRISAYQQNLFDSTVFVNGRPLSEKAVVINDVYYVPLRAVFEELSYAVYWHKARNRIE
ncbi:MAG: copper amine oxidase N-terminal domain-containing protein, partial [Clostridiales bacterium]|nr:copper amine oxidase N-terminal domain-containing protein [Clostridiales bacterium]